MGDTDSKVMETGCWRMIETLGGDPHVLVGVQIVGPRPTGMLSEKGEWIDNFWLDVQRALPDVRGCRALWDTAFFAVATPDLDLPAMVFQDILQRNSRSAVLTSFCCMFRTIGSFEEDMLRADAMHGELNNMAGVLLFGRKGYVSEADFDLRLVNGVPRPIAAA